MTGVQCTVVEYSIAVHHLTITTYLSDLRNPNTSAVYTCNFEVFRMNLGIELWCLTHFQQYFSYIVAISFIG